MSETLSIIAVIEGKREILNAIEHLIVSAHKGTSQGIDARHLGLYTCIKQYKKFSVLKRYDEALHIFTPDPNDSHFGIWILEYMGVCFPESRIYYLANNNTHQYTNDSEGRYFKNEEFEIRPDNIEYKRSQYAASNESCAQEAGPEKLKFDLHSLDDISPEVEKLVHEFGEWEDGELILMNLLTAEGRSFLQDLYERYDMVWMITIEVAKYNMPVMELINDDDPFAMMKLVASTYLLRALENYRKKEPVYYLYDFIRDFEFVYNTRLPLEDFQHLLVERPRPKPETNPNLDPADLPF